MTERDAVAVLAVLATAPLVLLGLGVRTASRLLSTQPPAGARRAIELGWRP